jgi:hypothetical protein
MIPHEAAQIRQNDRTSRIASASSIDPIMTGHRGGRPGAPVPRRPG